MVSDAKVRVELSLGEIELSFKLCEVGVVIVLALGDYDVVIDVVSELDEVAVRVAPVKVSSFFMDDLESVS